MHKIHGLFYKNCLHLHTRDREYHNLSVGQVLDSFRNVGLTPQGNQITDYANNSNFEGQAGQNALMQQLSASGYQSYQNKQALQSFQQSQGSAINTLQAAGTNLSDQYQQLLTDTLGQGTVAMNTATSGENAYLASRGLLSDAGVGNNQLSSAQLAVQQSNQAAVGTLGYNQAQQNLALQQAISQIQSATGSTGLQYGLEAGSLALSQAQLPIQLALGSAQASQASASARYISIPGLGVWDTTSNKLLAGGAGADATALSGVNGLFTFNK